MEIAMFKGSVHLLGDVTVILRHSQLAFELGSKF